MFDHTILSFDAPTSLAELLRFVKVLRILTTMSFHPNAHRLLDVVDTNDSRAFSCHFPLIGTTLLDWVSGLDGSAPPSVEERRRVASQLVSVVAFAHRHGIAHRYLTSSRILVDGPSREVRVSGFETAAATSSGELNYICPRNYRPPEVILSLGANAEGPRPLEQVDAWSIGCLLFEIATMKPLFSLVSSRDENGVARPALVKQQLSDIISVIGTPSEDEAVKLGCNARHVQFFKELQRPRVLERQLEEHMPAGTDPAVVALWSDAIGRCLQFLNTSRTSMEDLLAHPLFAGVEEPIKVVSEDAVNEKLVRHLNSIGITDTDGLL